MESFHYCLLDAKTFLCWHFWPIYTPSTPCCKLPLFYMLGAAKEHILGSRPRKLKILRTKDLDDSQVASGIGVPKKLAKTLKSICEGFYFLVELKLHVESLLNTFEIEKQLFSRNTFQITASDNGKTDSFFYNLVGLIKLCKIQYLY